MKHTFDDFNGFQVIYIDLIRTVTPIIVDNNVNGFSFVVESQGGKKSRYQFREEEDAVNARTALIEIIESDSDTRG